MGQNQSNLNVNAAKHIQCKLKEKTDNLYEGAELFAKIERFKTANIKIKKVVELEDNRKSQR